MKIIALSFALILYLSTVAGTYVSLAGTNAYQTVEYKTPPIISVQSPANNSVFLENNFLLNFTVNKPEYWLIHGGHNAKQMLRSINYELDGVYSERVSADSDLAVPLSYSLNLTNLTEGEHNLKVYAYATGWVIQIGFNINGSSDLLTFVIDAIPPKVTLLPIAENDTSNVPLNFVLTEPASKITYSLDNQANISIAGNTTLTNLSSGMHNVTLYAQDAYGIVGASETTFFTIAQESQPFPSMIIILVVVAVTAVAVCVGLLVYLRKIRH